MSVPPLTIPPTVTFGDSGLDRAAQLRADPAALAQRRDDPAARLVPLWQGKPLFAGRERDRLGWLAHDVIAEAEAPEPPVFLGETADGPRFAVDLSGWQPAAGAEPPTDGYADRTEQIHPDFPPGHVFRDLRASMTRLDARSAELAATARSLLGWHATHRFCARCGAPTRPAEGGWVRWCAACETRHFPRTDPVVIMLVTHSDRVLVGRAPQFPHGMFSLLAGFVEPGETLEAAVRRETWEEAGVRVGHVRYLLSQPWPFPASLMVACSAEALDDRLTLDTEEVAEALWLDRAEAIEALAGRHPAVEAARPGAVARHVIALWAAGRLDEDGACA